MNDETRKKLRDVIMMLIKTKGREPSVQEIAEASGVSAEEVRRVLRVRRLEDPADGRDAP